MYNIILIWGWITDYQSCIMVRWVHILTWCLFLKLNIEECPSSKEDTRPQWVKFAALISVQAKCSMFLKSNLRVQLSNMWISSCVSTPCIVPFDTAVFWHITI